MVSFLHTNPLPTQDRVFVQIHYSHKKSIQLSYNLTNSIRIVICHSVVQKTRQLHKTGHHREEPQCLHSCHLLTAIQIQIQSVVRLTSAYAEYFNGLYVSIARYPHNVCHLSRSHQTVLIQSNPTFCHKNKCRTCKVIDALLNW